MNKKLLLEQLNKNGKDLINNESMYSISIIEEFNILLGKLPQEYISFLLNFKTGHKSIKQENIYREDGLIFNTEVQAIGIKGTEITVEKLYTLPEVVSRIFDLDNSYGYSGLHRSDRLLPICSTGSSYNEIFIGNNDENKGKIFLLNPNEDLDSKYLPDKALFHQNIFDFVNSFRLILPF